VKSQLPPDPGKIPPASLPSDQPVDLDRLISISENERFLVEAYRQILGRECDVHGYTHYSQMLASGVSRAVVLRAFLYSPEGQARGLKVRGNLARFEGVKGLSFAQRVRLATLNRLRALVRAVFHAPIESLERKTEFLLNELLQKQTDIENRLISLEHQLNRRERESAPVVFPGGRDTMVAIVDGLMLCLPAEESRLIAYLAARGPLEPGLTKLLRSSLSDGMTFVDVGANFGWYSLLAAKAVGPSGKVLSLEPAPRTFALLVDNIRLNGLAETGIVTLHQAAASDEVGEQTLWVYPDESGHNTLGKPGQGAKAVNVPSIRLDDLLANETRVDWIKIDAEGWELHVLNGLKNAIRNYPALRIVIEFAPTLLQAAGVAPGSLLERIRDLGLSIHRIDDLTGHLVKVDAAELLSSFSVNLLLNRHP
jgi:FkbM family methyltransferase